MLRTILAIIGIIVAGAILYFVFFQHRVNPSIQSRTTTPLNIDLQDIKPERWQPIGKKGLVQISVDGDKDIEWLFLYRDDGDTGQIGGVIYDAQNQPKGVSSMSAAQQAPAYLIPYRLMPDYTANKSHGYLGDESVLYQTVFSRSADESAEAQPASGAVLKGDHLQVRGIRHGFTNRFSIFWWLNAQKGYGGALAYTPGWFSLNQNDPADWKLWDEGVDGKKQLITELWAWEPQMDRSNICRRVNWKLTGDPQQETRRFAGDYENSDLVFCRGARPAEPAFPEAQVLAYLLDKDPKRWQGGQALASFDNVSVRKMTAPDINADTTVVGVRADFVADGVWHSTVWRVQMAPPQNLQSSVHWRIVDVSSH